MCTFVSSESDIGRAAWCRREDAQVRLGLELDMVYVE